MKKSNIIAVLLLIFVLGQIVLICMLDKDTNQYADASIPKGEYTVLDVRENDDMISFILESKDGGDRYYYNVPDNLGRGKDFREIATIIPGDEVKYSDGGIQRVE